MKRALGLLLLFLISYSANAIQFQDLTAVETKEIMWDFNAHLLPTTVTPASSLGKYFGAELGVIAGASDSPEIDKIADDSAPQIPHASLFAAVHLPFGLGVEYSILPIDVDDLQYKYYATGIKWTFTDLWEKFPLDIRLRGQYAKGTISIAQKIGSVPIDVDYVYKALAANITLSKKLLFLEPYIGGGYIKSSNDLKSSGTLSIFDSNVELSQREGIELSSFYYFLGAQLNLFVTHIGLEFAYLNGRQKVSAKLSLAF